MAYYQSTKTLVGTLGGKVAFAEVLPRWYQMTLSYAASFLSVSVVFQSHDHVLQLKDSLRLMRLEPLVDLMKNLRFHSLPLRYFLGIDYDC